jgi:hypothetical protein
MNLLPSQTKRKCIKINKKPKGIKQILKGEIKFHHFLEIHPKSLKIDIISQLILPHHVYKTVKFNNCMHSIGDCLILSDRKGGIIIGKLLAILPVNGFSKYPYWPSIEIQR